MRNICLVFLLCTATGALAQADTTQVKQADSANAARPKPKEHLPHQLRIGFDISQPIINAFTTIRTGYELQADYYLKNDIYGAIELGWGSSKYEFEDLSYKSSNSFFRIGIDKSLLKRVNDKDWDYAFVGLRYGMSFINRGEGAYMTNDSLWGVTRGVVEAKKYSGYWIEITGGLKVELFTGFYAGWNVRGKFLMNQAAFRTLPPVYVAGYGKGDKNSVFDFNFYFSYALRWDRKK